MTIKKAGTVAIIGRPNVGKSTLLNALLGEKISITSRKPQTTRWQILGIKTSKNTQIVYIDTPGLHKEEKSAMNRYLNRIASATIFDVDVIVFMINALRFSEEDELVLSKLKETDKPVILAMNKIDLLKEKSKLLSLIDKLKDKFQFAEIIPISALKEDHVALLEEKIMHYLPEGMPFFPEDQITDKGIHFRIAEIIREKLIEATEEELPYTTTVQIERMEKNKKLIKIDALICVERPGQKIIVIGKGGLKLKKIGMQARREIEKLLKLKVFLQLWVKVKDRWTDDDKALKSLGYE